MKMSGNCPVQGYEIRDGWLFYFRARDGWSLRAWPPGEWTYAPEFTLSTAAEKSVEASDWAHAVEIDDLTDGYVEPTIAEEEHWYSGWWSDECCAMVAESAIAFVLANAEAVKQQADTGRGR